MRLVDKTEFLRLVDRCDLIYAHVVLNLDGDDGHVRVTKTAARLLGNSADRINVTVLMNTLYIGSS